jgi:poly(3-hydroxyalkanoate) synthetase
MDMHRRAMESLGEVDETAARDKLEWTTSNRVVVELAALRLRDFSLAQEGRHPALVVAAFALHDAALADLAPGHSLVETLLANGCSRIFLAEWKSATMVKFSRKSTGIVLSAAHRHSRDRCGA